MTSTTTFSTTSFNDKFTNLADRVSESMGKWQTSGVCLILVIVWAGFGPYSGYSDSWQLWVNTPTTVIELFLGLFTLAAANRVEKRNWELHQKMAEMLSRIEQIAGKEEMEIANEQPFLISLNEKVDAALAILNTIPPSSPLPAPAVVLSTPAAAVDAADVPTSADIAERSQRRRFYS